MATIKVIDCITFSCRQSSCFFFLLISYQASDKSDRTAKRTISVSSNSSSGTPRPANRNRLLRGQSSRHNQNQAQLRTDSSSSDEIGANRRTGSRSGPNSRHTLILSNKRVKSVSNQNSSTNETNGRVASDTRAKERYNTQPMMIRTLGSSVQVRTEQKATKVLGLVFFVFVVCWAPFFMVNVTCALWPAAVDNIPGYLLLTFQWLGFLSSTMNPIIYTIFNRNFRETFRKLVTCQLNSDRRQRHTRDKRSCSMKTTKTFNAAEQHNLNQTSRSVNVFV